MVGRKPQWRFKVVLMLFRRDSAMLTIAHNETQTADNNQAQIETAVSDVEISRRVLEIRAGWSVSERVRRRQEAERRFSNLLDALNAAEAA